MATPNNRETPPSENPDGSLQNAKNSNNRSDKKPKDADFESAARAFVAKKAGSSTEIRRLFDAVKSRPDGRGLISVTPAENGRPLKIEGRCAADFEELAKKAADPAKACGVIRSVLIQEIAKERILVESRSETLVRTLEREFQIPENVGTNVRNAVRNLSSAELGKILANADSRERFLWEALNRPKTLPPRSSRLEHLSKIDVRKSGDTPEQAAERAEKLATWQKAIVSGRLTDRQAQEIIAEFENPEDRKILVRALIPNSNLGALVDKGFVTKAEAAGTLEKAVQRSLGDTWEELGEQERV